jgi:hypothetical protein
MQLETVETELKHTIYNQHKVLKLTGLKRRSRGHQKRLKWIKDGKDMAKTRFSDFSVKKQDFQGFICKKPGAKT